MASIEEARAAKVKVGRILGDHPDLRGVGIARANGSFGLKVNLSDGRDAGAVPCDVDGVPVLVEVVGEIRARPDDRPAAEPVPGAPNAAGTGSAETAATPVRRRAGVRKRRRP